MSNPWNSGLFDCFSPLPLCCLGTWCPCILYGQNSEKKDNPQSSPSGINGSCFGWYALSCCGLQCILQMSSRREIRSQYNIQGSGSTDFFSSWCCACCSLIQENKEIEAHAQGNVAGMNTPYAQQQGQMTYTAPVDNKVV